MTSSEKAIRTVRKIMSICSLRNYNWQLARRSA